jgi:hypothetical protein
MTNDTENQKDNNALNSCFWHDLDRRIRRTQKFINWMIDGQFQHGISPNKFPNLTPERVEEIYNVDFGD